jgi:hypothetical protein
MQRCLIGPGALLFLDSRDYPIEGGKHKLDDWANIHLHCSIVNRKELSTMPSGNVCRPLACKNLCLEARNSFNKIPCPFDENCQTKITPSVYALQSHKSSRHHHLLGTDNGKGIVHMLCDWQGPLAKR